MSTGELSVARQSVAVHIDYFYILADVLAAEFATILVSIFLTYGCRSRKVQRILSDR